MAGSRCHAVAMVVCVVAVMALGRAQADRSDDRVAELMHMQEGANDGVIRMDESTFRRFLAASDQPRHYSLIVFFDAQQLRGQTELKLEEFRREFALVAASYIKRHRGGGPGEGKVFFCDVEFKEAMGVFRMFDVQTLPHVRHLPPGSGGHEASAAMLEFPRSAEGVAAFVTAKTRFECGSIERPPFLTTSRALALLGLGLVSGPVVGKRLAAPGSPLRDARVWMAGSLAIYFFSVSGGMHNIIRKMPLFMVDRNDPSKLVFFYHGSGMQLGTEGFVVGFLYTIVGILLGFVTHVAPNIRSKNAQRVLMVFAIGVSFVAVRKVIALDNWKTGYWIHAFWPTRWT
jgi:oligosaccharyltransferase complex subunit gamma